MKKVLFALWLIGLALLAAVVVVLVLAFLVGVVDMTQE